MCEEQYNERLANKGNETVLRGSFLYHSSSCCMATSVHPGHMCWDDPAGKDKASVEADQRGSFQRADFQGSKG